MPRYSDVPDGAQVLGEDPTQFSDVPQGATILRVGTQDSADSKGPIKRFLNAAWSQVNPMPAVSALGSAASGVGKAAWDAAHLENPLPDLATGFQPLGNMALQASGAEYAKRAMEDWKSGHPVKAVGDALLANPAGSFISRGYEGIGEKLGEGDIAGALGDASGAAANVALMEGGGRALGSVAEAPMGSVARSIQRKMTGANTWFKKMSLPEQKAVINATLEHNASPNFAGATKMEGASSAAVDAYDDIAHVQHGLDRLDVNPLQEHADLLSQRTHRATDPANVYRGTGDPGTKSMLEGRAGRLQDQLINFADPAEVLAAKKSLADAQNVNAQLQHTPGWVDLKPEDISDAQLKISKMPMTATVDDLMNLKRQNRAEVTDSHGKFLLNNAAKGYANGTAAVANKIVTNALPDLIPAGEQARVLIDAHRFIDEGAQRAANRGYLGITGSALPVTAGFEIMNKGLVAGTIHSAKLLGIMGAGAAILRSPTLWSKIAIGLYKTGQTSASIADIGGRLSAAAAVLDQEEARQQKEAEAKNAK